MPVEVSPPGRRPRLAFACMGGVPSWRAFPRPGGPGFVPAGEGHNSLRPLQPEVTPDRGIPAVGNQTFPQKHGASESFRQSLQDGVLEDACRPHQRDSPARPGPFGAEDRICSMTFSTFLLNCSCSSASESFLARSSLSSGKNA